MDVIGSLINVLSINAFSLIYDQVAVKLNNWENHRTNTQYEDALITKTFVFEMINNYFVLFFIAFLKEGKLFGRQSSCHLAEVSCDVETRGVSINGTFTPYNYSNYKVGDCFEGTKEIPSCLTELQLQLLIVFVVN